MTKTQERVTADDLGWWLQRSSELEWIWAKTYAATAPHSYVIRGRTAGMSDDDYVRAGRVIHTFGRPAKFYDRTDIYLEARGVKWWTMDRDVRETGIINQATTGRLYGVQNAPGTESIWESAYDGLASGWDEAHPTDEAFAAALRAAFDELRSEYPPSVLDIGCGTGRVLDLGLARPERYAGVDASGPMLNQLVRKHPKVGAVYPLRVESTLSPWFTPGQFEIVTALMPKGEELPAAVVDDLHRVASRGAVIALGDDVRVVRS